MAGQVSSTRQVGGGGVQKKPPATRQATLQGKNPRKSTNLRLTVANEDGRSAYLGSQNNSMIALGNHPNSVSGYVRIKSREQAIFDPDAPQQPRQLTRLVVADPPRPLVQCDQQPPQRGQNSQDTTADRKVELAASVREQHQAAQLSPIVPR